MLLILTLIFPVILGIISIFLFFLSKKVPKNSTNYYLICAMFCLVVVSSSPFLSFVSNDKNIKLQKEIDNIKETSKNNNTDITKDNNLVVAENTNSDITEKEDEENINEDENINKEVESMQNNENTVQNNENNEKSKKTKESNLNSKKEDTLNIPKDQKNVVVKGILIVNKKYGLSSDYAPEENKEAKKELLKLIEDMRKNNLDVSDYYSGYRSYERQKQLYEKYVKQDGKELADTYSAKPGHSEHQTGLAFDLVHNNGKLLSKPKEADFVAKHAHKYGFIVRYQKGKESITGYNAEPWHLRYVGKDIAKKIYESGKTLEEYLGVEGGNYPD